VCACVLRACVRACVFCARACVCVRVPPASIPLEEGGHAMAHVLIGRLLARLLHVLLSELLEQARVLGVVPWLVHCAGMCARTYACVSGAVSSGTWCGARACKAHSAPCAAHAPNAWSWFAASRFLLMSADCVMASPCCCAVLPAEGGAWACGLARLTPSCRASLQRCRPLCAAARPQPHTHA